MIPRNPSAASPDDHLAAGTQTSPLFQAPGAKVCESSSLPEKAQGMHGSEEGKRRRPSGTEDLAAISCRRADQASLSCTNVGSH